MDINDNNKKQIHQNFEISQIFEEFEKTQINKELFYSENIKRFGRQPLLIKFISELYEKDAIIFNKNYQREYVWSSLRIKSELIKSIILQLPVGFLTIREHNNNQREILDGQQRIKTILAFMGKLTKHNVPKKFNLNEETSRYILEQKYSDFKKKFISDQKQNITSNVRRFLNILKQYNKNESFQLSWSDLPTNLQSNFLFHVFDCVDLIDFNEHQIKDYFRVIQNQEKLKAAQILKSHDKFKKFYKHIKLEELTQFCQLINFNNSKNEVAKILANVVLLDQNRVPLNAMDETILKTFNKIDDLSANQINLLEKIKQSISIYPVDLIDKFYKNDSSGMFRRFSMKLLLLAELYSKNELYLSQNLLVKRNILKKINSFTKILNSKDYDTKKTEIPDEITKDINEIWRLSRTSHKKDDIITCFRLYFDNLVLYVIDKYPETLKDVFLDSYVNSIENKIEEQIQ